MGVKNEQDKWGGGSKSGNMNSFEHKYSGSISSKGHTQNGGPFRKREFYKKIIVDIEGYGDVQSLDEALELAQDGTVIRLCEGVHISRTVITKGGIKIEPYYKDRLVYILGNEGPALKIDV